MKAENTTPDRPADISVFRSGHSAGSERRRLAAYKATVSKRNKEPKVKFLRYCRKYATVVSACDAVGVRTSTFYQWKRDDPVFAGQVKDAEARVEKLEQTAHERARKGLSDSLTMFLLKHLKPSVFNPAIQTVSANVSLTVSLTPDWA